MATMAALASPLEPIYWPLYGLAPLVLFHLVPWLRDPFGQRDIAGPFIAQFSYCWLALSACKGKRIEVLHRAHMKYAEPALANRLPPVSSWFDLSCRRCYPYCPHPPCY